MQSGHRRDRSPVARIIALVNFEKQKTPPDDVPLRPLTSRDFAACGALIMLAVLLRWPQMYESLWLDELHTGWCVAGGLGELPARCAIGNQSPLWFLLPWLSTKLFGLNEIALRLPSLLAGIAIVPVIYWLVRWWSASITASVVAATLATFDQNFLTFSVEARPYACVQLMAVVQVAGLWWRCWQPSWKSRVGWIAGSAFLFYLHYTAALVVVAECGFLLMMQLLRKNSSQVKWKNITVDLLAIGLLLLPAVGHLLQIADRRDNWRQFVSAPDEWREWMILPLATYLIVPALLAYLWILLEKLRGIGRPLESIRTKFTPLILTMCWLLVPLVIILLTTWFDVAALWMTRYVIASAAAVVVLAGLLCGLPNVRAARIGIGMVTLLAALFFAGPQWFWYSTGQWTPPRGEDWRSAVAHINSNEEAGAWPILLRSALIEADALPESDDPLLREYALLPIRSIYEVPSEGLAIPLPTQRPGVIGSEDVQELQDVPGVWIVTRGSQSNAELTFKHVLHTLARADRRARSSNTQRFGSVWVMRVEFNNPR